MMAWVPNGELLAGSGDLYPRELPVHLRPVPGLWVDHDPVTNAAFRRSVICARPTTSDQ
jgi:formylglycine-generating enzyme required for sulfatase activity